MTENIVHKEVDVDIYIDGDRYLPTKVETDFNRYTQSDMVTATVVPAVRSSGSWTVEQEPRSNAEFSLVINGRRVFTGFVYETKYTKDGAFEVKALDAIHTLKTETVTLSITDNSTLISEIVANVCQQAGVRYNVDLPSVTADQHQILLDTTEGTDDFGPHDMPINIERTDATASQVLDTLAKRANADWWISNENVVEFGLPDSHLRQVEYVKEASAGMTSPPYRGVKVIGGTQASQHSTARAHATSEERGVAKYGIWYDDGQRETDQMEPLTGYIEVTASDIGSIMPGDRFTTDPSAAKHIKDEQEVLLDTSGTQTTDEELEEDPVLVYEATEKVTWGRDEVVLNQEEARGEGLQARMQSITKTVPVRAMDKSRKYAVPAHTITRKFTGDKPSDYQDDPASEYSSALEFENITNPQHIKDTFQTEREKEQDTTPGWKLVKGKTNSPVFTVKDKEIARHEVLEATAKNLILQLRKQVVSGDVTIVGDPTIDTLDVIQLPHFMGGEKYFVGKVNHKIDSNGFVTKIGCEGLVPGRYHDPGGTGSTADFDGAGGQGA